MTQDKETLREAVRAAYLRGFNSVPSVAVILPDGTPAAHWAGLDAAITTMFERLRTPREEVIVDLAASLAAAIGLLERGGKAAKKAAPSDKMFDLMVKDYKASLNRARKALTAFQQENSDAD